MRREAGTVQQLEEVERRLEEMEDNRRNNLILYGLANDPHETHSSLHQKVNVSIFIWPSSNITYKSDLGAGSREKIDILNHSRYWKSSRSNFSYPPTCSLQK